MSDVTMFRFKNRWFYICVVIDLFSRKVIAYHISKNNSTQLTKTTLKKAIEARGKHKDLLFHSDNGGIIFLPRSRIILHKMSSRIRIPDRIPIRITLLWNLFSHL